MGNENQKATTDQYRERYEALFRGAGRCRRCPDQGYYTEPDPETGDAVQVQCEFCWTNPLSNFNVRRKEQE